MPLFTRENAREMQKRSAIARTAIREEPGSEPATPQPTPLTSLLAEDFLARRLLRVRAQLDALDAEIEAEFKKPEPDGQRIDRLAAASMRLNDQEFALAGRPKPGQRRPGPDRKAGPWVEVQAAPMLPAPAAPAPETPACGPDTPTGSGLPAGCEPGTPQERK